MCFFSCFFQLYAVVLTSPHRRFSDTMWFMNSKERCEKGPLPDDKHSIMNDTFSECLLVYGQYLSNQNRKLLQNSLVTKKS